eukprot:694206-Rhodomonas_salina.1
MEIPIAHRRNGASHQRSHRTKGRIIKRSQHTKGRIMPKVALRTRTGRYFLTATPSSSNSTVQITSPRSHSRPGRGNSRVSTGHGVAAA